jgi:dTDP-4-amino-4,6-dideoxygalactose transaminase
VRSKENFLVFGSPRIEDDEIQEVVKCLAAMTRRNIGVHYLSIPEHPFYQETFGWMPGDYPHVRDVGRRTVSLPLSAKLTDRDLQDVIEAVHESLHV